MRVGTGISVLCENTYTVEELCQEQSFTLYRLLHVTDVQVNGQKAAVEQKDNYLLVRFPSALSKGDTAQIAFAYSGPTSPMLPSNDYQLSLLSAYPWMPRVGLTLLSDYRKETGNMAGTELAPLFAGGGTKTPVSYRVTIPNRRYETLFCNLPRVDDHTWQGTTDRGVTMVAHVLMRTKAIDGVQVYYPATGEGAVELVTETLLRNCRLMTQMHPDLEATAPKQVVYYPVRHTLSASSYALTWVDQGMIGATFPHSPAVQALAEHPELQKVNGIDAFESIVHTNEFFLACNREPLNKLIFAMYVDDAAQRGRIDGQGKTHFAREEREAIEMLYSASKPVLSGDVDPEDPASQVQKDKQEMAQRAECIYALTQKWLGQKPSAEAVDALFRGWYRQCVVGTDTADSFMEAVREAMEG